jgi:uncharacterized protein YecE (DUF72 family)
LRPLWRSFDPVCTSQESMTDRGRFRIGTSGWQYDDWRGVFYPSELPRKEWFRYYARHFDTVEVNNTFYQLPSERTFDSWREQAPSEFCFALKFSRYATQMKKLKEPGATIGSFMERASRLRESLGPLLVQLPPRWKRDVPRLAAFLDAAPSDVRWAIEFRDASWLHDDVFGVLRNHGAGLVIHDLIENHPREITADFVYLRFHGVDYSHQYSPLALSGEAAWIRDCLERELDVYTYFNNDYRGYAVSNALVLRRYVENG